MSTPDDPAAPFGHRVRSGRPRKSFTGAPGILTDQITQQIVDVLTIGSTIQTACALAGISIDSFYRWSKRGAREARKGKTTRYTRFSDAVRKAMAMAVAGYEAVIAEAAKGSPEVKRGGIVIRPAMAPNWQAAMTWLERRQPRDYARRTYRIEEERSPQASVGTVAPYQVQIPAADALPSGSLAPPHQESIERTGGNGVKCKRHDSDGGEPAGGEPTS